MEPLEPECLLTMGGTKFFVDLGNEWIYEIANPANFISFNQLEEEGQGYRMVYDPQTKNIFKGDEEDMMHRNDLKYIKLDQLRWMPAFGFVWSMNENILGNRMKR
jgi:hypothetical protein